METVVGVALQVDPSGESRLSRGLVLLTPWNIPLLTADEMRPGSPCCWSPLTSTGACRACGTPASSIPELTAALGAWTLEKKWDAGLESVLMQVLQPLEAMLAARALLEEVVTLDMLYYSTIGRLTKDDERLALRAPDVYVDRELAFWCGLEELRGSDSPPRRGAGLRGLLTSALALVNTRSPS